MPARNQQGFTRHLYNSSLLYLYRLLTNSIDTVTIMSGMAWINVSSYLKWPGSMFTWFGGKRLGKYP